jgi:endonuclease YncB( thermonuclease family)
VVGVSDGDTLTILVVGQPPAQGDRPVRQQITVRVSGIDAPEKAQPFGERSKQALSQCAFGKQALIDVIKRDRFGRSVAKLTVDGTDCGLRQIQDGLAWHFRKYMSDQPPPDRVSYAAAQDKAREERLGLWADPSPVPPWEFRHPRLERSAGNS